MPATPISRLTYGTLLPSSNSACGRCFTSAVSTFADRRRVFFFQAEDGIRDDLVTGVQTCALPIFWLAPWVVATVLADAVLRMIRAVIDTGDRCVLRFKEIGRASCRERV